MEGDPFKWDRCFVAFDCVSFAPCVVKVTDSDHPERSIEKAAIIGKTEAAVWAVLAKTYGSKDDWIKTRFAVRPTPHDVTSGLHELKERLELDGFIDNENTYIIRELQ